MSSTVDREDVLAAFEVLQSAVDGVCGLGFAALTNPERLVLLRRLERVSRQLLGPRNDLIQQLTEQASPTELGAKNLPEALSRALSISRSEARRRTGEAADLAGRTSLTGDPLPPSLEATAAALAAGGSAPSTYGSFAPSSPRCPPPSMRPPGKRPNGNWPTWPPDLTQRVCAPAPTGSPH